MPEDPVQPAAIKTVRAHSLYASELDPIVTEQGTPEIFNGIGPSTDHLFRNATRRRSPGLAYDNHFNTADSNRLDYTSINGRPCRIEWNQRDLNPRNSPQCNLFIKNLDWRVDEKTFHDTFASSGDILSRRLVRDDNGHCKGHGYVLYDNAQSAESAIQAVDGRSVHLVTVGFELLTKLLNQQRMAKFHKEKQEFTNVYVSNLHPNITKEEFISLFSEFGMITSSVLLAKGARVTGRRFGLVNFENHADAVEAIEALHGSEHYCKELCVVKAAQTKAERDEESRDSYKAKMEMGKIANHQANIYIKDLGDIDNKKLRELSGRFGTIVSTKVFPGHKGNTSDFGFVLYSSPKAANKAIAEMNGKVIGSKPLHVSLARVQRGHTNFTLSPTALRRLTFHNRGAMGLLKIF